MKDERLRTKATSIKSRNKIKNKNILAPNAYGGMLLTVYRVLSLSSLIREIGIHFRTYAKKIAIHRIDRQHYSATKMQKKYKRHLIEEKRETRHKIKSSYRFLGQKRYIIANYGQQQKILKAVISHYVDM